MCQNEARISETGSEIRPCQDSALHLQTGECALLARCKYKPVLSDADGDSNPRQLPIYESLTPLRCVLAKKFSRQNFEIMMKMEQHTEVRKMEPFYQSRSHPGTLGYVAAHLDQRPKTKKTILSENSSVKALLRHSAVLSADLDLASTLFRSNSFIKAFFLSNGIRTRNLKGNKHQNNYKSFNFRNMSPNQDLS